MTRYHVERSGNRYVVVAVNGTTVLRLFPSFATWEEAEADRLQRAERFQRRPGAALDRRTPA